VGAMDGGFPARRDGNVTDIYDGLQVSVNIYKMVECSERLFEGLIDEVGIRSLFSDDRRGVSVA